jgi:S-DNA-T family DNA segregation ATPase FtsK/SpoIIIE
MPSTSSRKNEHHFGREMLALTFFSVALFLLLALLGYSLPLVRNDPPVLQQPVENWCGSFGVYVAHYLFSFFGITAFSPVLLFFYLAVQTLFARNSRQRLPFVVAGLTGLLISASALLAGLQPTLFPPDHIRPGGYLGHIIWQPATMLLGHVGSALVFVVLLLFSLMATVRFSLVGTTATLTRIFFAGLKMSGQMFRRKTVAAKKTRGSQIPTPSESIPQQEPDRSMPVVEPTVHEPLVRKPEPARTAEPDSFSPSPVKPGSYQLPPLSLLEKQDQDTLVVDKEHFFKVSKLLVAKLADFGVRGTVEGISPGPVVTTYEFAPAAGVKINKIVGLSDDIAMALKVDRVRVVGSIPGKAALGIEIPNPVRSTVFLRDILLTRQYQDSASLLSLALGFDVVGQPVITDLARMPHLLLAGATGAGKSVAINAFIASILFKATPEEVRLLMIDPKRIELSVYEGIPHLLHPVVVEPKMASRALLWAVREMERRYRLLEEMKVKSFVSYNRVAQEKLPYVVIIVDELADLMMVASKDVETSIARLAQMARAAGMHIILATQRPSVDVLTGLIKANFPARISFKVSSKVDSRTILDSAGAEHLLGMGDMLFLPPGAAKLQRIHGAYISEKETEQLIEFLKGQGSAEYDESVMQVVEEGEAGEDEAELEYDAKYDEAVAVVTETGQASISMVQRRLRVGYNRAARMIEMMEKEGIVGPADGSRPREVLVRGQYAE